MATLEMQVDKLAKDYKVELTNLQSIPSMDRDSAVVIINEIGTRMSVFPDKHHLVSCKRMSSSSIRGIKKVA